MVKDARVTIPTTTPKGNLRILFSDADVVNRSQRALLSRNRMVGLTQLISMMNQEHANGWLYITLLGPGRTAFVQDKVLPSLPSSVANVIDPSRTQNRLTLRTGSSLHQQAIPVDYVISGSQTVVVRVK